jgi:ABC-type thiamin/hydroxymethylpyrimidine transport system permease subunit
MACELGIPQPGTGFCGGTGMGRGRTYFTTRDLLMMAALAALGGVVSTYVNAIGDLFQSVLGFAGTTQWAAGLHVLWLTLAVGLTRKQGAGTVTGILKGGVELLSGNTHGLLVVLVDIVAGLLVDLGFFPFRDKDSLPAFCLAGGLASASNVFVFQLFASVPADTLAYWAMLLVAGVAFLSGVLFAGVLSRALMGTLRRAGVVRDLPAVAMGRRAYGLFLVSMALLTVVLTVYLRGALRGPMVVHIGGAVESPYDYPRKHEDIGSITAEGSLRGVVSLYTGVPVRELVGRAQPQAGAGMILVRGADGYSFFVSMEEVEQNGSLLLAPQGEGDRLSFDIVGARNSKAWVRGLTEITVVGAVTVEVSGALESPSPYDPDDWQFDMDSARLDVGYDPHKYQGVPLGRVLEAMIPQPEATAVQIWSEGGSVSLSLPDVLADEDLRLFTIIAEGQVSFALARMDGQVLVTRITRIEVQ